MERLQQLLRAMINPLKAATDGYLKRTTKAALIIAVSGYLNFGTTPPIPTQSPIASEITGGGYQDATRRQQLNEQDEQEILLICEAFLRCHS